MDFTRPARSQPERTGQEDRRLKFYGLRDNLQLTVRVKPAQKARKSRNPATSEEITIAAKPASVDLRARPLAKANGALPSVASVEERQRA